MLATTQPDITALPSTLLAAEETLLDYQRRQLFSSALEEYN